MESTRHNRRDYGSLCGREQTWEGGSNHLTYELFSVTDSKGLVTWIYTIYPLLIPSINWTGCRVVALKKFPSQLSGAHVLLSSRHPRTKRYLYLAIGPALGWARFRLSSVIRQWDERASKAHPCRCGAHGSAPRTIAASAGMGGETRYRKIYSTITVLSCWFGSTSLRYLLGMPTQKQTRLQNPPTNQIKRPRPIQDGRLHLLSHISLLPARDPADPHGIMVARRRDREETP